MHIEKWLMARWGRGWGKWLGGGWLYYFSTKNGQGFPFTLLKDEWRVVELLALASLLSFFEKGEVVGAGRAGGCIQLPRGRSDGEGEENSRCVYDEVGLVMRNESWCARRKRREDSGGELGRGGAGEGAGKEPVRAVNEGRDRCVRSKRGSAEWEKSW